jgi:Putative DNA-binding domain
MDITNEVAQILGQEESSTLEYKAILPPSRNIAQLISAFANTDGGYIILGVSDDLKINGLSEDFHANEITHKAIDLLSSQPQVFYQYVTHMGKKLYVIKVKKSDEAISVEGKMYERIGASVRLLNPPEVQFQSNGYSRLKVINQQLEVYKQKSTSAKIKLIEHYQSILKIFDDLGRILYPIDADTATNNQEGKVLNRILFSSLADNFETYLSDLLYEIFLANPATLKSKQEVTIEAVLNCSDLEDFVKYWAKEKIGKLQKGSVKGFIKDNKQIRDLNVLDKSHEDEIEKILQIRHLYSHRNGITDEKFLQYAMGEFPLHVEHRMSTSDICDKLCYLVDVADQIDSAAIAKYKLEPINN